MISYIKGEKKSKYNYNYNDYKKIIEYANNYSILYINHFFDLIGINKEIFNYLDSINILVDYDKKNSYDDSLAFYENIWNGSHKYDNSIHLLPEYLDDILDNCINAEKGDIYFDDLINTLIHEKIHSLRSIMMSYGVIYPCSFIDNPNEYKEYSDKYFDKITKGKYKYNVLSVEKYNGGLKIVTYNRGNNNFTIFILSSNHNIKFDSCFELEKILNEDLYNRKPLFKKYIDIKYIDTSSISLVANYSTYFRSIHELHSNDLNLCLAESYKQKGFEESMTEAFAKIIMYLSDKDKYDISNIVNKKNVSYDVKLALEFINDLDEDTIRWFFLSCFYEEYENRFYKLYKNDYFKLIDTFNSMYESSMDKTSNITEYNTSLGIVKRIKKNSN